MKNLVYIVTLIISTQVLAETIAVRKADILCNFKKMMTADGRVIIPEDGILKYTIDLDSKEVVLNCNNEQGCLLDGKTQVHDLNSSTDQDASFAPIFETTPRGVTTIHSNLPTLIIEGGNGDDMEMFTRFSFGVEKTSGVWGVNAFGVLIYAFEGNDGMVSLPTKCSIQVLK